MRVRSPYSLFSRGGSQLTTQTKPTNRPQTERVNLTNNRRIETDQLLLTGLTRVLQPITSRLEIGRSDGGVGTR